MVWGVGGGMGHPEGQPQGALQRNVFLRPRSSAPGWPPLGPWCVPCSHQCTQGIRHPGNQPWGPLRHSAVVRLRPGNLAPSRPPLGPVRSRAYGAHAHGNASRQVVDGLRTEVCGQQKQSNDPHNNQRNPNMPTTLSPPCISYALVQATVGRWGPIAELSTVYGQATVGAGTVIIVHVILITYQM